MRRTGDHTIRILSLTVVLAAALAGPAAAQDRKALREACLGDVQKHCANVKRGEGRIVQCLRTNEASITPACRDALTAAKR